MKILSIETSCDETAVSIIEAGGGLEQPKFKVLSDLVLSQVKTHEKYGGVFPNLAKREHSKNVLPLIEQALKDSGLKNNSGLKLSKEDIEKLNIKLSKEPELFERMVPFLETNGRPDIDLIAVTSGPGLEPALWVGINTAKTLAEFWQIPVMPINHMEGHISSVLVNLDEVVEFPAVALLISGGHTEFVLVSNWLEYKLIGQTRDDAVGEAYDKVARMIGLPYPGGPQISMLAEEARRSGTTSRFNFPRPMVNSNDFDFSFSGLKTAVLYTVKELGNMDENTKKEIAQAFEQAVVDTLVSKTKKVLDKHCPKTLIVAGGVIANNYIRENLAKLAEDFGTKLLVPTKALSTDNALMIAVAAYLRSEKEPEMLAHTDDFSADGNLSLS